MALYISLLIRDIVDFPTWTKNANDCCDSSDVQTVSVKARRSAIGIAFLGFSLPFLNSWSN